jgi:nucleoid DNA-binding protein
VRIRKSRVGRNPNQPTHVVTIPTRKVVKFKMGRIMKAKVMKPVKS